MAHCPHQVWDLIQGNLSSELSVLSGILVLTLNLCVVKEELHVLEGLSLLASFEQVHERIVLVSFFV